MGYPGVLCVPADGQEDSIENHAVRPMWRAEAAVPGLLRRRVLATCGDGKVKTPREIAITVAESERPCDGDDVYVRAGMIEALRWALPHVWPDMRAEVSAKLAELEKP